MYRVRSNELKKNELQMYVQAVLNCELDGDKRLSWRRYRRKEEKRETAGLDGRVSIETEDT